MDQQEIDRLVAEVRQALDRRGEAAIGGTIDGREPEADGELPRLVTEVLVEQAKAAGRTIVRIAPGAIVTPLARDALARHGIALASAAPIASPATNGTPASRGPVRPVAIGRVALGVVPGARELESVLASTLRRAGFAPIRVPSPIRDAAHLARQVAGSVSGEQASWGIVADETGMVGPAVANRVRGVIAVSCRNPLDAAWARERIGANVLCIATDVVATALAREILDAWIGAKIRSSPDIANVIRELDAG